MNAMPPLPRTPERKRTELSTLLYWISILLLVWGGRTLIDPSNRQSGEVGHIYITLAAFEGYIWLLLVVARWQAARGLTRDVARFGLFGIFVQGLVFMCVNELHMADQTQGLAVTGFALVLAAAKLILGARWMRIAMPAPLLASSLIWIAAMAVPGVILRAYGVDFSTWPATVHYDAQYATAFISCWALAILAGLHLALVAWQRRRGFASAGGLAQWWVPWAISMALLAMAVAQLYTAMWGLWVDWSQWYFTPIYVAIAVVAIALSLAARRWRAHAWALLVAAAVYFLITYTEALPEHMPSGWTRGVGAYILHPLYPNGVFVSVLFAAAALAVRHKALWMAAAVVPVAAGLYKLAQTLAKPVSTGSEKALDAIFASRYGKGVALLLSSFLLLGAGVLVQWHRERRKAAGLTSDSSAAPPHGHTERVDTRQSLSAILLPRQETQGADDPSGGPGAQRPGS